MTTTTLLPANTLPRAAAAAASALAQAGAGTTASSSGSSTASGAALQSLAGNFTDFLDLLMTQLKNQDPTQPMDTDSFTTELVQFTGVQEQVSTNASLGQLIQLTQGDQLLNAGKLVGHGVTATAPDIALQSGSGTISFTGTAGQPVAIAVVDAAGNVLRSVSATAQAGTNTWTWNGQTDAGAQAPDGAYRVAVEGTDARGQPVMLPTSVIGTATGTAEQNGTLMLDIGALPVPMTAVTTLGS